MTQNSALSKNFKKLLTVDVALLDLKSGNSNAFILVVAVVVCRDNDFRKNDEIEMRSGTLYRNLKRRDEFVNQTYLAKILVFLKTTA